MSAAPSPQDALKRAWALLAAGGSASEILSLIEPIASGDPGFAQAQHIRGACAARQGDPERARTLLVDAIGRGESTVRVWENLTAVGAALDLPDDILSMVLDVLRQVPTPRLFPIALRLLGVLGFGGKDRSPLKDRAFETVALPILALLLERRDMDGAMALEGMLYENYVKPTETEAHFAWCMERISPLFTKAAHRWRAELPPLPQPALKPPYRVGFFVHNASMLAHVEVLVNILKGYRMLDDQPFEPTVYCFSGNSPAMEQALSDLGVRLVMLKARFPEAADSSWARLLKLRELVAAEGVQELVWVSLVTILPLAFTLRMAPVQTWLAMKYRNFSHPEIDGYVTGSALSRFGTLAGRRWRMGLLGLEDWYDPRLEPQAAGIRAALGAGVVLMTLARTEKMRDPTYLETVCGILRSNPHAVFLWAGREESPEVVAAFREAGVLDRTRFIGWVNTRLYAQVADIFLDTFPFPCGFTLYQAMAARKPVVIYTSAEAAQTGLWGFLKPVLVDGEGSPEARAELWAIVGDAADPRISIADTPLEYAALTGRLITDAAARAAAGEASGAFIARYFSDPRTLGSTMSGHFVELIEERRAEAAGRGSIDVQG